MKIPVFFYILILDLNILRSVKSVIAPNIKKAVKLEKSKEIIINLDDDVNVNKLKQSAKSRSTRTKYLGDWKKFVAYTEQYLNFNPESKEIKLSKENAEKQLKRVQSEGFASSNIQESANGLFRVYLESYKNKDEALTKLNKLKASGKSVWLLE